MSGLEENKRKSSDVAPIDKLAKSGHFKENDLPGTDTYDEGMNEKGETVTYGSTSTESSGNYQEDKGPNDLRYRGGEEDVARAEQAGLKVVSHDELNESGDTMYQGNDAAARWLRKNDKDFKGGDDQREAA